METPETVDYRGRIVVIRGADLIPEDEAWMSRGLIERGAELVLFVRAGEEIAALDEAAMRENGWVRAPE